MGTLRTREQLHWCLLMAAKPQAQPNVSLGPLGSSQQPPWGRNTPFLAFPPRVSCLAAPM